MVRDPNKTARNRIIANIKIELRKLLPAALKATGFDSEASLNAKIGSKHAIMFDLKNDVILSSEVFITTWLKGLKERSQNPKDTFGIIYRGSQKSIEFRRYLLLFLRRSYFKKYDALSKERPQPQDSILWIGQNNANYGLLVTPRFKNGQWENDKSHIRLFEHCYWTIGHVMETGLVVPGRNRRFGFSSVDQYLTFFTDTLVRNSGSKYELEVADHYVNFVLSHNDPNSIPLMIPEYRYGGLNTLHVYRLDFLVTNPFTLDKIGFELSPWSTHGHLAKTKSLTNKQINTLARDNFEGEMK